MKTNNDIKLGVSFYSYQDNLYFQRHDLEGCIAAAAGAGAEGIEVFPETFEEWPFISDTFVDKWNGMMERYGIEPVCLAHFSDRAMWKNKHLSDDEMFERGVLYIKAAKKLGCSAIRVMHEEHNAPRSMSGIRLTDYDIIARLLPIAAENGVMLALECHSPSSVEDEYQYKYIELAEKTKLPFVGLQSDFSSYEYCITSAEIVTLVFNGATREILEYVRSEQRKAYFEGKELDEEAVAAEVKKMKPNDVDIKALSKIIPVGKAELSVWTPRKMPFAERYAKLKEYASKIVYVHAKFHNIDEDGQADNIDYPKIFNCLIEGGYKGYITSEFEGSRRMNMVGWCDEIEYVRKHHILMRKCLGR